MMAAAVIGATTCGLQSRSQVLSGIPNIDLGSTFTLTGYKDNPAIPCFRHSNDISIVNKIVAGTLIKGEVLNGGTITYGDANLDILRVRMPGDSLVFFDTAQAALPFTSNMAFSASNQIRCRIENNYSFQQSGSDYWRKTLTGSGTQTATFNFDVEGRNLIHIDGPGVTPANSNKSRIKFNGSADFDLVFFVYFGSTTAGRSITIGPNAGVVINSHVTVPTNALADDRNPLLNPGRDDSWVNLPLPSTTVFYDESHIFTQQLRDQRAAYKDKRPSAPTSNYFWIPGFPNDGIPHVMVTPDMPFVKVRQFKARRVGQPMKYKPFNTTALTGHTFYVQMPAQDMQGGQVGDKLHVIYDIARERVYEFGNYSWDAATGTHVCGTFRELSLYDMMESRRFWPARSKTLINPDVGLAEDQTYHRAGALPVSVGQIRYENYLAGELEGVLCCQLGNALLGAGFVKVVSPLNVAGGFEFVVRPYRSEFDDMDLTPHYSTPGNTFGHGAGTSVGGNLYTMTGDTWYNSDTGNTHFTVNEPILASTATVGGMGNYDGKSWVNSHNDYACQYPNLYPDGQYLSEYCGSGFKFGGRIGVRKTVNIEAITKTVSIGGVPTEVPISDIGKKFLRSVQKYGLQPNDQIGNSFGIVQMARDIPRALIDDLMSDRPSLVKVMTPIQTDTSTLIADALAEKNLGLVTYPKPLRPLH